MSALPCKAGSTQLPSRCTEAPANCGARGLPEARYVPPILSSWGQDTRPVAAALSVVWTEPTPGVRRYRAVVQLREDSFEVVFEAPYRPGCEPIRVRQLGHQCLMEEGEDRSVIIIAALDAVRAMERS